MRNMAIDIFGARENKNLHKDAAQLHRCLPAKHKENYTAQCRYESSRCQEQGFS